MIPQQTPVNQKQKQKLAPYKMHAPSLFPGPKPNHLISLCLINGWFGNMSYLYMSNFPRETPQSFSQKHAFYKMAWLTKKKPYKMPPFVIKMPLEWDMGQAISKWKYTQG